MYSRPDFFLWDSQIVAIIFLKKVLCMHNLRCFAIARIKNVVYCL